MMVGAFWDKASIPANVMATGRLLLSSLVPLFGTWVGTVLAFYFSRRNFEAANRSTLDLVQTVTKRLSSTRVVDVMTPRNRMITLDLPVGKALEQVVAAEVDAKFQSIGANGQRISRLPVLDANGACVAFLHRSLWSEMLAGALATKTSAFDPKTDSLGPLLVEPYPLRAGSTYHQFVTGAIAFVGRDKMVGDAKVAMEQISDCQDVIVTEGGTRSQPVLGWLSNVDIGRLSQA